MSTDIGGRPVLRPAGNVARANLKKATKPPPSPVKPHALPLAAKISPPNSQPPTPRSRSLLSKPSPPPSKHSTSLSPTKPSSPPPATPPPHAELVSSVASLHLANEGINSAGPDIASDVVSTSLDGLNGLFNGPNQAVDGSMAAVYLDKSAVNVSSPALTGSRQSPSGSKASTNGSKKAVYATRVPKPTQDIPKSPSSSHAQKTINPRISLTKSTSEVFQRGTTHTVKAKPASEKNLGKFGSLSFDESSLATMAAARKAAANEAIAQRKLKVSEYGRKQGKAGRVAPEASLPEPAAVELKRCKFITAQSDPLYVAYHDKEWGMPVYDDRMLFELLVLSGFQVELSWSTILQKRDTYRTTFLEFSPSAVAQLTEKQILSLEADKTLGLPGGKVRGIVENARRIMEVIREFGSLDTYLWGFLNNQPMVNNYRYPKQVPVKTSKAESISKVLVRRGFRFVGPTIIYSFMQAAGMTNDHLVECFRHQECMKLASPPLPEDATKQEEESNQGSCHQQQVEVLLPPTNFATHGDSGEEMLCAANQEPLTMDDEWPHQPEMLMDITELGALDFSDEEVLGVEEGCFAADQDVSSANDQTPEILEDLMEPKEQECHEIEVV